MICDHVGVAPAGLTIKAQAQKAPSVSTTTTTFSHQARSLFTKASKQREGADVAVVRLRAL
jgi:hypothetical protein